MVASSLTKAEGFVGTAEQERFDECEEAIMGVLSQVRTVARQWKVTNLTYTHHRFLNEANAGRFEQNQIF